MVEIKKCAPAYVQNGGKEKKKTRKKSICICLLKEQWGKHNVDIKHYTFESNGDCPHKPKIIRMKNVNVEWKNNCK